MTKFYLDSSFLVAFLLDNHDLHKLVEENLLTLAENGQGCFIISTLTIDEVWYTLYELTSYGQQSFATFTKKFTKTINEFLNTYGISIVDTLNGGAALKKALAGSIKYNLRPRDAFHYSFANLSDAVFYTLDEDFTKTDLPVELIKN